jgi:ABC-type transport system involved in Fe-S cluster assembly fused permease/ATPase subunit
MLWRGSVAVKLLTIMMFFSLFASRMC